MKTIDEMIAVMRAFKDGKKIKVRSIGRGVWNVILDPTWDWSCCDYEVVEESKIIPYGPEDVKFLMGKVVEFDNGNIGVVIEYSKEDDCLRVGSIFYTFEYLAEHAKDVTLAHNGVPFGRRVK